MRSTNRKRVLLVSGSVILLCLTIISGMTFALFTDDNIVSNHLVAGDLEISLWRTNLVKWSLDETGFISEKIVQDSTKTTEPNHDPIHDPVNFTNTTSRNVFDFEVDADGNGERIVPGCKYVATMEIENNSDVAFGYWIEVKCTDTEGGEDLAEQLKVTVNTGDDNAAILGDGLTVKGENGRYIGVLAVGDDATFTVTLEFLDSFVTENDLIYNANDKAQTEKLDFDLVVYAVQVTTAPGAQVAGN